MSIDTGFRKHIDIEVSGYGVSPSSEKIAHAKRTLRHFDGGPQEVKWFKDGDLWIWSLGVPINA